MDEGASLRGELQEVLRDARFVRSPVLSKLLAFLVDATLRGDGKALKSYAVAVEGLGRSADFDSNNDTYPRVQVARLRRALEAYYSSTGSGRPFKLEIRSGSYEVWLVRNAVAGSPVAVEGTAANAEVRKFPWRPLVLSVLGLLPLIVAIAVAILYSGEKASSAQWERDNFPQVTVQGMTFDQGDADQGVLEFVREKLFNKLSRFEGLRVIRSTDNSASYAVVISYDRADATLRLALMDRGQRQIYVSPPTKVPEDQAAKRQILTSFASASAFRLAGASGLIGANEWQRAPSADTPYGCWLYFLQQLRTGPLLGRNAELESCANNWHQAMPNDSKAAALYAWTVGSSSMTEWNETRRKQLLKQAVEIADLAKAANPHSAVLQLSKARAQSLAGDLSGSASAARRAVELNPDNLDVMAFAGTLQVLGNDPGGEALVRDAIARHEDPPAHYFIGQFIAAMMRDDLAGADAALQSMSRAGPEIAAFPILKAALNARSGKLVEARQAWDDATRARPILKINPNMLFQRLPMAPTVAGRLKAWMSPILG